MIETPDGKIVGRFTASSLRIQTKQFGELTMKIADVRSLRSQTLAKPKPEAELKNVLPDPGDMKGYETMLDKTFRFRVTGKGASCWGTDQYTTDSSVGAAAVHAGLVKIGQTAVVQVKVVLPPLNFTGTTRNGITTRNWGSYPGAFEFVKPKKQQERE